MQPDIHNDQKRFYLTLPYLNTRPSATADIAMLPPNNRLTLPREASKYVLSFRRYKIYTPIPLYFLSYYLR